MKKIPGTLYHLSITATRDGKLNINIWYRLWFRQLEDKSIGKKYKIALKTSDGQEKTTNKGFLRIQRLRSVTEENGNLIITQVNIIV